MEDDRGFAELALQQGLITQAELEGFLNSRTGKSLSESLQDQGVLSRSQVEKIRELLESRGHDSVAREALSPWETLPELSGRQVPGRNTRPDDFLLGKILLEWKLIESEQLVQGIQEQDATRAQGREIPLGEVLVGRGWLTSADLSRVLKEQAYRREGPPDLARYEIRERVGQGATAVVYRAWDRELGRLVAIKVLRDSAGITELARRRFKREGQAVGGLSHSNVVTVHDAGEAQGRPYIVMELVEGQPLDEIMRARRFSEGDIVALIEKAARGVAAAHAQGIVHRDLKPANILLTPQGEPKVGDFGLAHLTDSSIQLTRTGATLGTPLYMAPEQVRGSAKDITPRTDVYALGAILYELLSGQTPLKGDTLMEIYRKIAEEEPAPLRTHAKNLSRDLETIVQKAMDKTPARRYPDAGALADDLGRYRTGEPIFARPATPMLRVFRKASRYRATFLAGAIILLTVVGLGAWNQSSRSSRARLILLEAPQMEQAQGVIQWVSSRGREPAEIGRRLLLEEGIETSAEGSSARLKYPDLSSVELGPDTQVLRSPEAASQGGARSGKGLRLERGTLRIHNSISKVPPVMVITPVATLELGEGEHGAQTTLQSTFLEVHSGQAKATRRKDGRTVTVGADQCVTIEEGGELEIKAIIRSRKEAFARSGGVDASLVGYWKLDDGKGAVAADSSGHGHIAKLIGGPQWLSEGSIQLDGKGAHVELPSDPELDHLEQSDYTLSIWYKPSDTPVEVHGAFGTIHGILMKGPWRIGLLYTRAHNFVIQHYLAGETPEGKNKWAGTGTWDDHYGPGHWFHVAAVVDRENGKTSIYVDARPRYPVEWPKNSDAKAFSMAPWKIGALEYEPGKTAFFAKGELMEVRMYNRALGPEEIDIVRQAGLARRKQ